MLQKIIDILNDYWGKYGCAILPGHTSEIGAGTLHPATVFNAIRERACKLAYVQPVIRPADSRYGVNPNRLYQHHQYQVLIKPSPDNLQDLYLQSLAAVGIDLYTNDIKFIEDDWENPSIGAWGLGWEVQCNGMEITQFTYMQQVGGIECGLIPGELAYGLERLAIHVYEVNNVYDLCWNKTLTYKDLFKENEQNFSAFVFDHLEEKELVHSFVVAEKLVEKLLTNSLPLAAYEQCLKASHILNLLDVRKVMSNIERTTRLLKIRNLVKACCELYLSIKKRENV